MKLRLVSRNNKLCMYCMNGSIKYPTDEDLIALLTGFNRAYAFRGNDGYWNVDGARMESLLGKTLAFVDDENILNVVSRTVFANVLKPKNNMISATEYAAKHNKCRASIKNMCVEGRIPGAIKHSTGWLIPEDAPYPKRKNAK